MAGRERIPAKFLQTILLELTRRGLVRSRRGHGGGYQLARDPASIDFGEVVRALDGPLALTPCVSLTAYQRCDECADEQRCGIRLVMKAVRDSTARILEGASLATVNRAVDRVERPRARHAAAGREKAGSGSRKAEGRRAGGGRAGRRVR